MPNLSLPLINSLLLALLWLQLFSQRQRILAASGALMLIATCALCSLMVGLRWGGGFPFAAYLQPLVAAILPTVCWHCLRARVRTDTTYSSGFHYGHLLPIMITIVGIISRKWLPLPLLDLTLITIYMGYGAALIYLAWRQDVTISLVRGWRRRGIEQRRCVGAGTLLILSAALDIAIALDFSLDRGTRAVYMVATANLLTLVLLVVIFIRVGNRLHHGPMPDRQTTAPIHVESDVTHDVQTPTPTDDDYRRVSQFDRLMRDERLYADPDLSILKLSKRLGMSVRQS
ncbi:hypothetical protein SJI19_23415 [Acerihabitans sp. TG2]|uniref:hypothetical protein n=1 Tax=Acerihabitans sp. TG2 TaxID=3096008 RepID=UPI002B228891|nr:hypothetical protein [Acerihabitans sp. TG2]MEA9393444.1 hypothetical protein [Acerihabitans sp. TG2]